MKQFVNIPISLCSNPTLFLDPLQSWNIFKLVLGTAELPACGNSFAGLKLIISKPPHNECIPILLLVVSEEPRALLENIEKHCTLKIVFIFHSSFNGMGSRIY